MTKISQITKSNMNEPLPERCPTCGFYPPRKTWHPLGKQLVSALAKLSCAVGRNGTNRIHLLDDMKGDIELTRHEWNNFTSLRYHGLVAHADKDNLKSGYWLLTRRGSKFLKGILAIPKRVLTQDNHVIDHDPETMSVWEVRNVPHYEHPNYEISDGETYIPEGSQIKLPV